MKFKEIKPGMVIHCPTGETVKALYEHLEELGFVKIVYMLGQVKRCPYGSRDLLCYKIAADTSEKLTTYFCRLDSAKREGYTITEFSDLIEPDLVNEPENKLVNEMSAVEVLEWLGKNYGNGKYKEVFGYDYKLTELLRPEFGTFTPQEVVDKITAYEAAKKAPKPVEVEWVDICRIIQIQDNGFKKCVYEEVLPDNDGCVDYQNAENILKKYISEHEGQYIAVNEGICRVKEDK